MADRSSLLDQLKELPSSQWDELTFRLGVDKAHLRVSVTPNQRSIDLIELMEQQENGLQELEDKLNGLVSSDEAFRLYEWEVNDAIEQIFSEHQVFVSRSEINQIDKFLEMQKSGLLLITAGAGFGKTSLLVNWVRKQRSKDYFIARHFFNQRHDVTCSLTKAYRNLLCQLHKYFKIASELPEGNEALRREFYNLIRTRATQPDQPLVIVIDALDEAEELLSPFFQMPLPRNVFVIVSARANDEESPKYLQDWLALASEKLHLEPLSNVDITQWLKQSEDGKLSFLGENDYFIRRISEVTEGFPLYLRYLIEELYRVKQEQDLQSLLEQLPIGFEGYVEQQVSYLDQLNLPSQLWQFFALLAVAKGALAKEDIKAITRMCDRDLRQLEQCWQVTRWIRISQKRFYAFTHPLLGVAFAQQLGDDSVKAARDLVDYCSKWQEHCSLYALRHYMEHLQDSRESSELYKLACNPAFTRFQRDYLPNEPGLLLKTIQAALCCASETDNAGTMAEFLLFHAHRLANTVTHASPLDILRNGDTDEALRATGIYECQLKIYILWNLLLAWELQEMGQNKKAIEILRKSLNKELPNISVFDQWQYLVAAHLLTYVFELDPALCVELGQRTLGEKGLSLTCEILCRKGYYVESFEIEKTRIRNKLADGSFNNLFELLKLLKIVEIQAEKLGKEVATKLLSQIAEFFSAPGWELFFAPEWARLASLEVNLGREELGKIYFNRAVDIAKKTQSPQKKAQLFLNIIHFEKEAGKTHKVFLEHVLEILQSNDLENLDNSGLYSRVRFSVEAAKIQALLSHQIDAQEALNNLEKTTEQIEDFSEKAKCFIEIGEAYLEIGELDDASRIAKEKLSSLFSDEWSQFLASLAQEYFKIEKSNLAWQIIDIVKEQWYKDEILSKLALAQANQSNFEQAFEVIHRIEEGTQKESVFLNVLQIQIQNLTGAIEERKLIDNIEAISNSSRRNQLWFALAEQQLKQKRFSTAQRTTGRIVNQENQEPIKKIFAIAYAEANNFKEAIEFAEQINDSEIKAETVASIALIQIEAGHNKLARETIASLLNIKQKLDPSSLRTWTLPEIADVQIKLTSTQEALTTIEFAAHHVEGITDSFVQAGLLAKLGEQRDKLGFIQEAQDCFRKVLDQAQAIRAKQQDTWRASDGCSQLFAILAETQARVGDFDAAYEAVRMIVHDSALKANALKTIANEQKKFKAEPFYWQKLKESFAATCEEVLANPFSAIINNRVQVFCTIAIAEFVAGEQQLALETLASLREQAQGQDKAKILAEVAIAEIQIEGIDTALKTSQSIDDPDCCLQVLWSIANSQFKNGLILEIRSTLDAAHNACQQIGDEKKRLNAMQIIAGIQMMAGLGSQAIQTVEYLPEHREHMLPFLAHIAAEAGDLQSFKQLLIPCAYHLNTAYEMCVYLAKLYPEKATEIVQVVTKDY